MAVCQGYTFVQKIVDNNERLPGCSHATGARYLVSRQLFDEGHNYTSLPGCGGDVRVKNLATRQLINQVSIHHYLAVGVM